MKKRLELCRVLPGDTPETTVLAGPWCFVGNEESMQRHQWPDARPFSKTEELAVVSKQATEFALYQIRRIGVSLNQRWGRDYPEVFWKTLLGPWALDMVHLMVERFRRLNSSVRNSSLDHLYVKWTGESFAGRIRDTLDFQNHAADPAFNAYICAVLLKRWKPSNVDLGGLVLPCLATREAFKEPIVSLGIRDRILFWCPFLPGYGIRKRDSLLLSLVVLARYAFRNFKTKDRKDLVPVSDYSDFVNSPFPFSVDDILDELLPKIFLSEKNLQAISPKGSEWLPRVVSIELYTNEGLKYRVALGRSEGVWVAGRQHGSFYGTAAVAELPYHVEYSLDRFYSWGWHRVSPHAFEAVPVSPSSLGEINRDNDIITDEVIFVSIPIFLSKLRLDSAPQADDALRLRKEREVLFKELEQAGIEKVVYRPFWEQPNALKDAPWIQSISPSVALGWNQDFHGRLKRARLIIVDAPSTTFSYALSWNVPTIAFWNPEDWASSLEAKPYFDALFSSKIVFRTAQEAVEHICSLDSDFNSWWASESVQKARSAWVNQYAAAPKRLYHWAWTKAIFKK